MGCSFSTSSSSDLFACCSVMILCAVVIASSAAHSAVDCSAVEVVGKRGSSDGGAIASSAS
eukprot:241745-Prymnesium_polylepis.1